MLSYGRAQFIVQAAQSLDVEHILRDISEHASKWPVAIRSEELVELYYKIFNPGEVEKPIPITR